MRSPSMVELAEAEVAETREATYPLPLAEDWEAKVLKSEKAAEVIDKHLDFESKLQGTELNPLTLCPDQKVSMATDIGAVLES